MYVTITALADVAVALLDLVAPAACAGCGDRARLLCDACHAALTGPPRVRRVMCADGAVLPVVSVASYAGVVRAMLLAFKERGRAGLARPLGSAAARAALACEAVGGRTAPRSSVAGLVLVPVPSSAAAVRRRGYDPVRRLAAQVVEALASAGVPVHLCPALRLCQAVRDQAGLTADARHANLAGAHRVTRRSADTVAGREVLIVDDVITTGATLTEAARALQAAGARPVGALTVGSTILRGRPGSSNRAYTLRTDATSVSPWRPPGSVVASSPVADPSAARLGKPMPAAGETAHVRRLFVVRSRCGLGVRPAPPEVPMSSAPGEGG